MVPIKWEPPAISPGVFFYMVVIWFCLKIGYPIYTFINHLLYQVNQSCHELGERPDVQTHILPLRVGDLPMSSSFSSWSLWFMYVYYMYLLETV